MATLLRAILGAAALAALVVPAPAAAYPGDLDPSFGRFGKGSTALGTAEDLAIESSGRIVVAGAGLDFATFGTLVGYTADGEIDPAFAVNGFAGLVPQGTLRSVAELPDGRLLAGGLRFGAPRSIVLVRTLADGTPDPSFGSGGVVDVTSVDPQSDDVDAAVAPGGAIVLAASTPGGLAVTRLLADGTPDPAFAGGTALTFPVGKNSESAVAASADGGATASATAGDHGVVVRATSTGVADPAFSQDGVAELPQGTAADELALDAEGRPVVAGAASGSSAAFRLTTGGAPDSGFGGDGRYEGGDGPAFADLAIQPDGRIVFVGDEYSVTRLTGEGAPDPGFGRDGVARTSMPSDASSATAVALQADGRIAVAGITRFFSFRGETRDIAPARYLNGGSKRDADADGFSDKRDRCRYDPARRHRGCPAVRRHISIKRSGGGVRGIISVFGPRKCVKGAKVALFAARRGPDRVIGRTRVRPGAKYRFHVRRLEGTYYSRVKGKVVVGIGLCQPARSRKLTVSG